MEETTERKRRRNEPHYCPNPTEIRAACLEIQREWSEERRGNYKRTLPTQSDDDDSEILDDLDEDQDD